MMTELTCQKHLFDIPDDVTYLNAAYMTPILKETAQRGQQAVAGKLRPWDMALSAFFDPTEQARSLMAQMIGAEQDDMAVIPAVSYGIATAVKNLNLQKGQTIILLEDQFPSHVYPWIKMAGQRGAEIITISRPDDGNWTDPLIAAIDERCAIVACMQAHWTDGSAVDLVRIGQQCRKQGAALVLDLTQSLGVMPFSIADVDPDYMIAACYKWLLGPYSYGFLYVAPRHQKGEPLEENWIARKGSDNFARLVDYQTEYEPGAGRFSVGERSNFMLTPMAISGLEKLNGWGVDNIARYLTKLTDQIAGRATEIGLRVADKAHRSPHLIGLYFEGSVPDNLAASLAERQIYVSVRGHSIRVSPHIYNDHEDVDCLFKALADILGKSP